jgi:predicted membrane protein
MRRYQGRTLRQALTSALCGGVYTALPRTLSLLLAIGIAGMIFTYPKALAHVSHGMLSLTMLGVCAGFVHGVGFVFESRLWRILFGPWLAWALMSLGIWLIFGANI